jgi:hypothetical protein
MGDLPQRVSQKSAKKNENYGKKGKHSFRLSGSLYTCYTARASSIFNSFCQELL